MHTLHTETSSVLSVTADENYLFSGSQGYDIFVSLNQLQHVRVVMLNCEGMGQANIVYEDGPTRSHWQCASFGISKGQGMVNQLIWYVLLLGTTW